MPTISIVNSSRKVWFTSDSHFNHFGVIAHCARPFTTSAEMNAALIDGWNSTVGADDIVIHLGDFSLATKITEKYTPLLNGHKWLVPGNHDSIHSTHKNAPERHANLLRKYEGCGWLVLPEEFVLLTDHGEFYCRHVPYFMGNDPDVRYMEYRTVQPYNLICGHIHEKWRTRRHDNGKVMINVGVDQHNFKPISLADIVAAMKETP